MLLSVSHGMDDSSPLPTLLPTRDEPPEGSRMLLAKLMRLRLSPEAPSRSALKLEEALLRFCGRGRPPGLHTAVDLGAAPGGWIGVLLMMSWPGSMSCMMAAKQIAAEMAGAGAGAPSDDGQAAVARAMAEVQEPEESSCPAMVPWALRPPAAACWLCRGAGSAKGAQGGTQCWGCWAWGHAAARGLRTLGPFKNDGHAEL